jgi:hypothetical protein
MTEAEWLACDDVRDMLDFLQGKSSKRKLRLFACACCRQIWRFIGNPQCQRAVEFSERYADRQVGVAKLSAVEREAYGVASSRSWDAAMMMRMSRYAEKDAAHAAAACARKQLNPHEVATFARACITATPERPKDQCALLRDLFGSGLFRPSPPLPADIIAWNDGTVRRIAEGIYEERAFDRLPILADALLDAGCDNEELLAHCRSDGPHVRGCWALDLILGKS